MISLLAGCLLASCNAVFGIEETVPGEDGPPDVDLDMVVDRDDNCRAVPNPGQEDRDEDGFGDACDGCPDLSTLTNHDEDFDRRGDACDVCPIHPDFQADTDGDGVGDACQYPGGVTRLAFFDAFETLDASWTTMGVMWEPRGDSVAPVSALDETDPGLQRPGTLVAGERFWRLEVGVVSTRSWRDGDRFGGGLVDANGVPVVTCEVICDPACAFYVTGLGSDQATAVPSSLPITRISLTHASDRIMCTLENSVGYSVDVTLPRTSGSPVLYGSPFIEITFAAAYTFD